MLLEFDVDVGAGRSADEGKLGGTLAEVFDVGVGGGQSAGVVGRLRRRVADRSCASDG